MTIIYADVVNHNLLADTKISFDNGKKPETGHTKLRWFGDNVVALCGLVTLASSVTAAIADHFGSSTVGPANIKLDGYNPTETCDGFIMTPDSFWVVLFGHGVISIIPMGPGLDPVSGSGSQWFNAYCASGMLPEYAFDMVCREHNDCGYPVDQVVTIAETQNGVRNFKLADCRHSSLPIELLDR